MARVLVKNGLGTLTYIEEVEKAFEKLDANAIKLGMESSQNARNLIRQVFNQRKVDRNNSEQKTFYKEVDQVLATPMSLKSLCRTELVKQQLKIVPKRYWEGQVPASLCKYMDFDDFL